jgi:hypothetical protein
VLATVEFDRPSVRRFTTSWAPADPHGASYWRHDP